MRRIRNSLIGFFLVCMVLPVSALADDLIIRRIAMTFPEAMNALQTSIAQEGFTVSRVQRVDIGLTSSGYNTAEYRIVFFMRPDEVHHIVEEHHELIPFLPLKITIFAEENETIVVTLNPLKLNEFFPDIKMEKEFSQWSDQIVNILDRVQAE